MKRKLVYLVQRIPDNIVLEAHAFPEDADERGGVYYQEMLDKKITVYKFKTVGVYLYG